MIGYHIEDDQNCYFGDNIMDDSSEDEFKRWFESEVKDFNPGSKLVICEYLGNNEDGYDCNDTLRRIELNSIDDLLDEFSSYLKTINFELDSVK